MTARLATFVAAGLLLGSGCLGRAGLVADESHRIDDVMQRGPRGPERPELSGIAFDAPAARPGEPRRDPAYVLRPFTPRSSARPHPFHARDR